MNRQIREVIIETDKKPKLIVDGETLDVEVSDAGDGWWLIVVPAYVYLDDRMLKKAVKAINARELAQVIETTYVG